MATWTPSAGGPPTAAQRAAEAVGTVHDGVQGVADGIHQAINGDSSTGTPKTASAVKGNLTAIPPKNITSQSYAAIGYAPVAPATTMDFSIPANSSIYIPPSKITQVGVYGDSIGATSALGLWLAEPGLYAIQTIATFKCSAGLSFNGALTPTLVYGDTPPPTSGTWTGSHTLPCGTSATVSDSNVTYCISANNTYIRTDPGNRYFMPGMLWSNSSSSAATVKVGALALIAVKIST